MIDDSELRIVSRGVTPEEIAAVSAVITGALEELAAAQSVEDSAPISAWQTNQRPIRRVLTPGPGAWRSFSG
ncbi:MAG: acyl-CoA carboxylase subunit epsilon [Rhodoglobus sp.]|nr:acyl-CoA carboxylase subunit epsilon [Rhodoglobus sp.]